MTGRRSARDYIFTVRIDRRPFGAAEDVPRGIFRSLRAVYFLQDFRLSGADDRKQQFRPVEDQRAGHRDPPLTGDRMPRYRVTGRVGQ